MSASDSVIPPLEDNNAGADFRRYQQGFNVIPADSVKKKPSVEWKQWQTEPIPEWLHNEWKLQNKFNNGYAIIVGRLWHGDNAGLYGIAIDYDKLEAVEKWFGSDWQRVIEASEKSRIEWHQNKGKLHYLLYTKRPLKNRNLPVGIEIRAEKELLYCGKNKDGNYWTALGTHKIAVLDEVKLQSLEGIIDSLSNSKTSTVSTARERNDLNFVKHEGENRSLDLLQEMDSLLIRNHGLLSDETIKQLAQDWHDKHCKPPYSREKFESNWKQARDFRDRRIQERAEFRRTSEDSNIEDSTTNDPKAGPVEIDKIEDISEKIMASHNLVTLAETKTKEILLYDNGVYLPNGEIEIEKEAERLYEYDLKLKDLAEIKGHIRRKTYHYREEFDSDLNIINLKNGLYNIETEEFTPHNSNNLPYLSMKQKPIPFNRSVGRHPSKFIQYLKQVVYPSDIWTVIELMAYTFYRDNPYEIVTILLGGGSNGKSVLFGILTALHGIANVSNVSLKTIIERPFGLYDLLGKDCNLDAEMSSGLIEDTAILKKMTGRQLIRVEQKNQNAFDARIHAKEWLNCNTLPQIGTQDQNDAFYRRNVIVGFPNKFEERDYPQKKCKICGVSIMSEEERADRLAGIFKLDPDLISKLTTEEELSAIFNLLMYALRGILKNERIFINEKTMQERRRKYEMAANPIAVFLRLAVDPESKETDATTKRTAYLAYQKYSKHYKLAVISDTLFGKKLKKYIDDKRETIDGKSTRVWKSIKLTEDYLSLIPEQETLDAEGFGGFKDENKTRPKWSLAKD